MIDRRELLQQARSRGLTLGIIEKDYVLGWILYAVRGIQELTLKGGTALAKIYFPRTWRLSEDLDMVTTREDLDNVSMQIRDALHTLPAQSGIAITIKSEYVNPGYLQLKAQYSGPLGKNWFRLDVTPEPPIGPIEIRSLHQGYTDYPTFSVRVVSLEEIFAEKLRSVIQRTKVRDYYDLWRMNQLEIGHNEVRRMFPQKMKRVGLVPISSNAILPSDLEEQLRNYWEKELRRLVDPTPDLQEVLAELRRNLSWIDSE